MYSVHVYPDPQEGRIPWTEIFEVTDTSTGDVAISDGEVRDHPEVPLAEEQRDRVLSQLGYRRVGPWRAEAGGMTAVAEPLG